MCCDGGIKRRCRRPRRGKASGHAGATGCQRHQQPRQPSSSCRACCCPPGHCCADGLRARTPLRRAGNPADGLASAGSAWRGFAGRANGITAGWDLRLLRSPGAAVGTFGAPAHGRGQAARDWTVVPRLLAETLCSSSSPLAPNSLPLCLPPPGASLPFSGLAPAAKPPAGLLPRLVHQRLLRCRRCRVLPACSGCHSGLPVRFAGAARSTAAPGPGETMLAAAGPAVTNNRDARQGQQP